MLDDGFYDMGPLREGARFPLLDELGAAPLDNRRPVFVVNALPSVSRTAETVASTSRKTRKKKKFVQVARNDERNGQPC